MDTLLSLINALGSIGFRRGAQAILAHYVFEEGKRSFVRYAFVRKAG